MRKTILCLVTLGGLFLLGACTQLNSCTGNGYLSPEYCTGTLHPNAGPYGTVHNK